MRSSLLLYLRSELGKGCRMHGREIADLIEKMIDIKISHHAEPDKGGAPQLNKIVGRDAVDRVKNELADRLNKLPEAGP